MTWTRTFMMILNQFESIKLKRIWTEMLFDLNKRHKSITCWDGVLSGGAMHVKSMSTDCILMLSSFKSVTVLIMRQSSSNRSINSCADPLYTLNKDKEVINSLHKWRFYSSWLCGRRFTWNSGLNNNLFHPHSGVLMVVQWKSSS